MADLRHAMDRKPDGTAWTYEVAPRSGLAWLRWRLGHWSGHVPPSRLVAVRRAEVLRRQVEVRAENARARAAAVPLSALPEVRASLRSAVAQASWAARASCS